jgi:hypothetical protein
MGEQVYWFAKALGALKVDWPPARFKDDRAVLKDSVKMAIPYSWGDQERIVSE